MRFGFLSGVDIFNETDRLQVIAELPGVKEDEISVVVQGLTLNIDTGAGERKVRQSINLGIPVKGTPKTHYRNGILEINLPKV
jgi:HSP20 family molecular chaperone IbpA